MASLQHPVENVALSSSPAFGTPIQPIAPVQRRPPPPPAFKAPTVPTILPILLPAATLRPLAFRTFTKKHNLTLNSSALQALATFIGRHCGSGWREEGTCERVLEDVAKLWKAESGGVIVEDGVKLKDILKTLEGSISGGKAGTGKGNKLSRESTFAFGNDSGVDLSAALKRQASNDMGHRSFGINDEEDELHEDDAASKDARAWLKVLSAFEQPRFTYDIDKKHFIQLMSKPSLFPPPSHKTALFRERYHVIHQRLLRNEAFQAPSFRSKPSRLSRTDGNTTTTQFYKITPIANLLGRGGTGHLVLGMLVIAPTGTLALTDLTGSISLDLQHAAMVHGEESAYFCPGMIVLVDGVYEEDWSGAGSSGLGNTGGVGGTIGGRLLAFSIGGPPVERRNLSLGVGDVKGGDVSGGFGWTDFLGLGSERAVGQRMKKLEQRLLGAEQAGQTRRRAVILAECTLDRPSTLAAIRKICEHYAAEGQAPMAFVLMGNFCSQASMSGAGTGSIEYKELFNELAAVLSDFPSLLRSGTWTFVPGDNDPWGSAFSAGASTAVPREGVPDIFTSRIKRAFATAKAEVRAKDGVDGETVWTSNPAKLSLFGPAHEVMLFRDNISGRLRRNAVRVGGAANTEDHETHHPASEEMQDVAMSGALPTTEDVSQDHSADVPTAGAEESYRAQQAKRLIMTLLPQSTLSPFSLTTRPVHWDFAGSLSLYPMPHALIIADAEAAPFAMTFEGCHVLNPGCLVSGGGRRKKVGWCEYDLLTKRGSLKEDWI